MMNGMLIDDCCCFEMKCLQEKMSVRLRDAQDVLSVSCRRAPFLTHTHTHTLYGPSDTSSQFRPLMAYRLRPPQMP